MSYSNPHTMAYRFPAAAIDTAAVIGRIIGPDGKSGRLIDVQHIITADTTVAASVISVGTSGDADAYGTHSVPIASANAGGNGITRGVTNEIAEDQVVEVSSDGGATAGDGDVIVLIDWY